MNKTINVNESSIVDLKAELFRKEEKFKQDQTSSLGQGIDKQSKGNRTLEKLAVLTGKRKKATKRETDDTSSCCKPKIVNNEEIAQYEKSKIMLQAKAKLYDKMSSGEVEDPEDDNESFYLVDFHKKVYSKELTNPYDEDVASGDEWVEFEDSLGRTRKCMKKDLKTFQALDQEFRPKERTPSPPMDLSSEDQKREMMRKKWEAEQEELSQNLERDIHYQNVLFDEVREHGVAYYQFSKDEAERKSQMETLNQLREQTMSQRSKREQIKAKRQATLNARLAKIKQKKLKTQSGNSDEVNNVETEITKETSATAESDLLKAEERTDEPSNSATSNSLTDSNSKISESILGDVGISSQASGTANKNSLYQETKISETGLNGLTLKRKDKKSSYDQWIKVSREERNDEFAPPSFYYDTAPKSENR